MLLALEGLDTMGDDAAKAHVIVARVRELGGEARFAALIERIGRALLEAGLIGEEQLRVNLHATVWNTRFRAPQQQQRVAVDARGVLKRFGSVALGGPMRAATVELSERGRYDERGYYLPRAVLHLP